MSLLLAGPYVGSFEQELLSFRPHVTWVKNVLNQKSMVVNTHANRLFMYSNVATSTLPVNPTWTADEDNQVGIFYKPLSRRDYLNYTGKVLNQVAETTHTPKEEIKLHGLNYIQNSQPCSNFQKTHTRIPIPTDIKKSVTKDTILYIPSLEESEERAVKLYDMMRKNFNVVVIGDHKTYLHNKNIIMKRPDYALSVYKCIVKWLSECQMVVCPASYWTFLCKLQGTYVFSWGENVAPYKYGNHSSMLPASKETSIERVYDQMAWAAEKVKGESVNA